MAKARTLVGLDDPCREGCRGDRRLQSGELRFDLTRRRDPAGGGSLPLASGAGESDLWSRPDQL